MFASNAKPMALALLAGLLGALVPGVTAAGAEAPASPTVPVCVTSTPEPLSNPLPCPSTRSGGRSASTTGTSGGGSVSATTNTGGASSTGPNSKQARPTTHASKHRSSHKKHRKRHKRRRHNRHHGRKAPVRRHKH
jgi:hypothetical protein